MKGARAPLALVAALALGGGCFGGLERTPPQKQRFMLQPAATASISPAPIGGPGTSVVRVARVRVSPVFDTKGFVYRTGPSRFETDFYNEFFAPPGELLRQVLLDWLDATQLFAAVSRSSSADADFVLETDVGQLFGDQSGPDDETKACLEMGFRLIDARTRKIVFEKRYTADERVADGSPGALVDAWNRDLGGMLAELMQDVRPLVTASASPK